jgi:hypothetical protein
MARTLSRRTFLRGAGAAVALPFLDAMVPAFARAQTAARAKRFVGWYVPNGIRMSAWTPAATGALGTLPPILAPLATVRSEVLVLSNLQNNPPDSGVGGGHVNGTGVFLTCTHIANTDARYGASLDQVIAQALGGETPLPSIQLGSEAGSSSGSCDGASCVYSRNVSHAAQGSALAKETNPRSAFDRLFQTADARLSPEEQEHRRQLRLSVLDVVREDAGRLRLDLGPSDRRKLDEYLTGVRELEQRIDSNVGASCTATPPESSDDYPTRVRALLDVLVLAFRCDMTRVATFMLGNSGSGRDHPFVGAPDGHHDYSHHQNDPVKLAALQAIDTWEVAQFAYLLEQLAAIQEPEGSLLDSTLAYFSSEISDGDRHNRTELPVLLAGRGGGAVVPGRHLRWSTRQQVGDLFVTVLNAFGIQRGWFGQTGTQPLSLT